MNISGSCHCTDCQKMRGAAFCGVVIASSDSFIKMTGNIKDFVKQSADSGNARIQAFFPKYGTHIYATSAADMPADSARIL